MRSKLYTHAAHEVKSSAKSGGINLNTQHDGPAADKPAQVIKHSVNRIYLPTLVNRIR